MNLKSDLPADAIAALQRNKKIEAIKIVREQLGIGLKAAKDAVEAYQPDSPPRSRGVQGSARTAPAIDTDDASRGGIWIAVVIALGIVAYLFVR